MSPVAPRVVWQEISIHHGFSAAREHAAQPLTGRSIVTVVHVDIFWWTTARPVSGVDRRKRTFGHMAGQGDFVPQIVVERRPFAEGSLATRRLLADVALVQATVLAAVR